LLLRGGGGGLCLLKHQRRPARIDGVGVCVAVAVVADAHDSLRFVCRVKVHKLVQRLTRACTVV
jgi:hypothetical protein